MRLIGGYSAPLNRLTAGQSSVTGLMLEPGRANIHRPLINIRPREMDESDENTEFETDASNVSRLLNRGYLWPAKGDRLFRSLDDRERSVEFS